MNLPPFNEYGLLPPGDYPMTLTQLRESYLVTGSPTAKTWDVQWRLGLVDNLEILAKQLWLVGVEKIFVDGSFVEDKDHPNDIDGYFEYDYSKLASRQLQRELNAIDPHKIWTWSSSSRLSAPGSTKGQLPMWHQYRVELYPHVGQRTGIKDRFGYDLMLPSAFRLSRRDHRPKGTVLLLNEERGND